jgi:type IV secretion system protein VirB9
MMRYTFKSLALVLLLSNATIAFAAEPPVLSRQDGADLEFELLPPAPGYISKKAVPLTAKEKRALRLSEEYRDRNIPPVMTDAGRVTFTYGVTQPSVICAPFMVSDIELQPGEMVNDVVLGDTARWKVVVARSGYPEATHLIVKPLDAGLETMAVITTDRRTYHIKLVSQSSGHTPYVGFLYPEEEERALRAQIAAQQRQTEHQMTVTPDGAAVSISQLDFAYTLDGKASWRPEQIYSDGRQTYIRLPSSVRNTEMPVLLVRRDKAEVLTNYRVKDTTLVVDEVFTEAVLLAGVGKQQQRVIIKKKES